MIRVSVDVYSRVNSFRATIWAESIEQALNLMGLRYPDCEATVVFPIDPETYFAKNPAPPQGTIMLEELQEKAG